MGTRLFVRTTRRVTLTPDGERLLARARDLIAINDQIIDELGVIEPPDRRRPPERGPADRSERSSRRRARRRRSVSSAGATAMASAPPFGCSRRASSTSPSGAPTGGVTACRPAIATKLVRWEPLGVLLPATHPLASLAVVPVAALAGIEIDVNPADPEAPDWSDLVAQFLELSGARATRAAPGRGRAREPGRSSRPPGHPDPHGHRPRRRPRWGASPAGRSGADVPVVDHLAAGHGRRRRSARSRRRPPRSEPNVAGWRSRRAPGSPNPRRHRSNERRGA